MQVLQNYINGKWIASVSGETSSNINPASNQVICELQSSGLEDAERAIQAAEAAFPTWRKIPMPQRAALLDRLLDLLAQREDEFARSITLENGKTLRESRAEIQAALKEGKYQTSQGRRLDGRHLPSDQPGVLCYVTRQPLGVVSLITPWNFPLNVACRKMFPALVAGNCCVLKPADFTPMTASLLIELVHAVGFPPGVVNFVTGRGSVIGDTLVCHPSVRAVSFTGSTEVGIGIAQNVAGTSTKIQLEMGGKNPVVVLADADLEQAANGIILGAFSCSGQWCTSTSRAIIEAPVYDKLVEMLTQKAEEIVVGNGLDETSMMGPVAGPKQYESVLKYIEIGKREGARLCTGGEALSIKGYEGGFYIAPTVFADVAHSMRIAREEIFGPVLSISRADDFEHAVSLANDTVYGLSASIYTNDLRRAAAFVEDAAVGLCHVNMPTAWKEPHLEFGGIKESGRGLPEAGESGAEFFTEHKAVYIRSTL